MKIEILNTSTISKRVYHNSSVCQGFFYPQSVSRNEQNYLKENNLKHYPIGKVVVNDN